MGKIRGKHNRIGNINLILDQLVASSPTGGSTIQELANICAVSDRNIYRYLNDIEKLGLELARPQQTSHKGDLGRYRLGSTTMELCQSDPGLIMMVCLSTVNISQYLKLQFALYEIFIRKIANEHRIFIPLEWTVNII